VAQAYAQVLEDNPCCCSNLIGLATRPEPSDMSCCHDVQAGAVRCLRVAMWLWLRVAWRGWMPVAR